MLGLHPKIQLYQQDYRFCSHKMSEKYGALTLTVTKFHIMNAEENGIISHGVYN